MPGCRVQNADARFAPLTPPLVWKVGTVDGYEQTARCMSEQDKPRPPLPPFDATTAAQKVRMAEAGWKT
jgi:hypothetical protein